MDWFSRRFVKSSMAWLTAGVTLGVAMAANPAWSVYRLAHLHMTLLGFVAMMIFGVGYHVLPRFTGHPLWSPRLAGYHWWIANAGLALMVIGFILRVWPRTVGASTGVLAVGGALSAAGAYAFAFNIWRTVDGPRARRAVRPSSEEDGSASTIVPLTTRRKG